MTDEEEEARRRKLIRDASGSNALTPDEQAFLSAVAKDTDLTWLERRRVRRLVGKVAAP